MSTNVILVIVGIVLFLLGLAKLGRSGGFNLSNFGINIVGTTTQTNTVGNDAHAANKISTTGCAERLNGRNDAPLPRHDEEGAVSFYDRARLRSRCQGCLQMGPPIFFWPRASAAASGCP